MSSVLSEPLLGELVHQFHEAYGVSRNLEVVWSPGRINLIGEHIDYNHLPVLPMAIQRGTFLVFTPRADHTINICTTDPRFSPRAFAIAPEIEPYPQGDWGNYVKAAAQTACERFDAQLGFDGLVYSTLPIAAGLSSSSSLLVATALALLSEEDHQASPFQLIEALADGERYVGVRGGGMDQSVILSGREGTAVCVSFAPLRLELVPVPEQWCFIVAHSMESASKSASARAVYNTRTDECREIFDRLVDFFAVRGTVDGFRGMIDHLGPEEVLAGAERHLPPMLFRRARHVVTETDRVLDALEAIRRQNLSAFGPLLCDSHRSLRDDYDVSTPALDELVETATGAGAAGARLTGAGLGGCGIAVCSSNRAPHVMEALTKNFYEPRRPTDSLGDVLFEVRPSEGARVIRL